MFLLLSHLNIFKTFILDKSILAPKPFGIDLGIFSIRPPPVILADE